MGHRVTGPHRDTVLPVRKGSAEAIVASLSPLAHLLRMLVETVQRSELGSMRQ